MSRSVVVVVSLLISCSMAVAGTMTPGLIAAYASRGASETLPVLVILADRTPSSDLAERLQRQGLSLAEIHERLMDTLKTRASTTQAVVLRSMGILKATGMAQNERSLWIVNALAADMNRAAAELVANMAEVSEVGLDQTVTLRKMIETSSTEGMQSHVEDGLNRLNLRSAWDMGFHGEGHIVCVIGDGAEVSHPALSSHWRGRWSAAAECWYDPSGGSAPSPCGAEGTMILGAMCGADAQSGDTIGSAPAAQWIAARLLCASARLSDLLLAWQWAADPDGNASTFTDVSDVIVNPWELPDSCLKAAPAGFSDAVKTLEALGPLPVFSVSNMGKQGPGSLRAPESLPECFSVGNVEVGVKGVTIHPMSGRGPSPCDGSVLKPDVVAPGTAVRTSALSATYARETGTTAAAAYVAGIGALLRQANPNLPAGEMVRVLTATAVDLGSPGPDNSYGFGLPDAGRAVLLALSSGPSGGLQGVVRYGGIPVNGAHVTLSGLYGELVATTSSGYFHFDHILANQRYALSVGRFGYKYYVKPDSVVIEPGQTAYVYVNVERGFSDDAEHDQGWSLGAEGDNATGGLWIRAEPVGSSVGGKAVQPSSDASLLGRMCFVTGNAASASSDAKEADVDGGHTTLRSPVFSLADYDDPQLKFSYWYSNDRGPNPGSDFFRAQISSDGGATWVNLINSAASTNEWKTVNLKIRDFVTPSERMMLQFVAEDEGPGSLVEAAVDDIAIIGSPTVPEPPRDLVMDVQFNQVVLTWRPSSGASSYKIYLSGDPDRVVAPENLHATTTDTTFVIPMSDIHFNQFFFQVTAAK